MNEKAEILRQNGSKGGRPKTKDNQTEPNETKDNQTKANESLKEKKRNEIKRNEMKINETSFLDDDDARLIQKDHDRVLNAAEDAGFSNSNSVRAALLNLYAENGLDKVLAGIASCVEHGATNLAYLKACMKDRPKQTQQPIRINSAQNFEQRDYSDVNDSMMSDLAAEMAEFQKGTG
jgi:hypothetical protein